MRVVPVLIVLILALALFVPDAAAVSAYVWPDGATFVYLVVPGTLTFVTSDPDTSYTVTTVDLSGRPVNVPVLFGVSAAYYWIAKVGPATGGTRFDVWADWGVGLRFIGFLIL
jgi:hypothetical protein